MAAVGIRRLRIWITIISFINLVLTAACYAIYAQSSAGVPLNLTWMDWTTIVFSIVIFFSYIYAVKGKSYLNKFIRAFLVLAISVLFLYINVDYVVIEVNFVSTHSSYAAFQCQSGDTQCYICWATTFMSIITGFFVVVDLFWTLKSGPLEPKSSQYGRYGYGEQANITIVSPDQPQQGVYHQMQLLAANPGQKADEQYNAPILETTQPYTYQQQPYMYQQPQQPLTPQSQYQPQFNATYQGSQGYSPQPFVHPAPQ